MHILFLLQPEEWKSKMLYCLFAKAFNVLWHFMIRVIWRSTWTGWWTGNSSDDMVVTYKKGQPTLSVCLGHGTHHPHPPPSYPPPHSGVRFTTTRAVNIKWRIIISSAIKYPINLWIPSHKVSIIIIIILILHSSGSGSTACVLKVDTRYQDDDDQERICYYMAFVAPQATTTTNR